MSNTESNEQASEAALPRLSPEDEDACRRVQRLMDRLQSWNEMADRTKRAEARTMEAFGILERITNGVDRVMPSFVGTWRFSEPERIANEIERVLLESLENRRQFERVKGLVQVAVGEKPGEQLLAYVGELKAELEAAQARVAEVASKEKETDGTRTAE